MVERAPGCVLCESAGGRVVFDDARLRVVVADEPFAGFCRVIWKAHVREMTDLAPVDRMHLMSIVFAVEAALRTLLQPLKMNLASLGNQVPHLHWHVIPRFADDSHYPQPVWGASQREDVTRALPHDFDSALAERIGAAVQRG
jgi:diadenosine tetraphosphate (Ap4A) HIT family hydrolase